MSLATPQARFGLWRQLAVSALWLAWYAQWVTIPSEVLPDQVARLLGPASPWQDLATGAVVAGGSVIALLVTPIAGALSDRSRSRFGRRRPYLAVGVLLSSAALAGLWLAVGARSLPLYVLAYLNLQLWWNWAAGPAAGFIPDVVPHQRQGDASAWTNALGIVGVIVGNGLVLLLYGKSGSPALAAAFVALNLVCLAVTLTVREPPSAGASMRQSLGAFLRSFVISPRDHPDFYLVLATRFFSNMGVWSVLTFLLYYLETVLRLSADAATQLLPALLGAGACLAIPASLIGVKLADRIGLVRLVQISSWVMAAATSAYVLIALRPSVALVAPAVIVYAIANGAYGAADWLLALRVLPSGQDTGKDFGVWHACMVAPQILGPLSMGALITWIRSVASPAVAYEAAFAVGAAWFVLGAALVGRVKVPTSEFLERVEVT
jgi:Na+/melibiose symporter-like transporter